MEIVAKSIKKDEQIVATQDLQLHTKWVIEEALKLMDQYSLDKVSKLTG